MQCENYYDRTGTVARLVRSDNQDAFGRDRVSEPHTIYDCKLQYDLQPLIMLTHTEGGGSVSHLPEEGCALLEVGTAAGDRIVRQSRHCTYQPGKSQLVEVTGTLGEPAANRVSRIGYFDDLNGVFYELTEDGIFIVFRSSVTGVTVDERVPQAEWKNKFDGKHPAFTTFDPTKSQIFAFDLQWLGVGRVRAALNSNGENIATHEFFNDNRKISTYWTSAVLPVRYEMLNTGTTAAPGAMRQICCSVQSEGGFDLESGLPFSAMNETAADIGSAGYEPVLSIRPKLLFKGLDNRAGVLPVSFDVMAISQNVFIEIRRGGTLTGASFADVDAESAVEFDTAATAHTGGHVHWRGFVSTSAGKTGATLSPAGISSLIWLVNNIDNTAQDSLTIVAKAFTNSADVHAALSWRELR